MRETTKRYAVECDSPDGGRSTYAECWGATATSRGRVLSEHDALEDAVAACDGRPSAGPQYCTPWIWDRRTGRPVGAKRLAATTA